ncbi:metal ABC transporter solute-binding protein, Zn/Mn family [Nostoc sp.]|uniref:metal ABC transporter solute-binding protein, Zn/Mn family n=1 Tax=Nostoc sp. TaxID=1180 RepID=UPI003FA5EDC4
MIFSDYFKNENHYRIKFRKRQSAITFDDAFPYLAKRYNLKQVAVVQIPEDQLSPTDVQNAVNAVKKYKVKALFSEPGVDNKFNQPLQRLKVNFASSGFSGNWWNRSRSFTANRCL